MDREDDSVYNDSGLDTDWDSDMVSITSSTYGHRFVRSRRFHGVIDNPYPLPNDEVEKDRLDELQIMFRTVLGENILVPIGHSAGQIVDLGTGSGKWVLEVANEYPSTRVIGMDLSPIQPTFVPTNAEFIVEDVNQGISLSDASTDVVHSRLIHAGVTEEQWPDYLKEIFRILIPGTGWAQLFEFAFPFAVSNNGTLPKDAALNKLFGYMQKDLREGKGILMDGEKLPEMMKNAGFVDVRRRKIRIEIGAWGPDPRKHEVATMCANVWTAGMQAFDAGLIEKYYPDERDVAAFKEAIAQEFHNLNYQLCAYGYLVIGRKPSGKRTSAASTV